MTHSRLSVRGFGFALGLLGAIKFGLLVVLASFGHGLSILSLLSSLFVGIEPNLGGFVVALVWGFVCGGFFGSVLAWLYNQMLE